MVAFKTILANCYAIKVINNKPTANIMLGGESRRLVLQDLEKDKNAHFHLIYST